MSNGRARHDADCVFDLVAEVRGNLGAVTKKAHEALNRKTSFQ